MPASITGFNEPMFCEALVGKSKIQIVYTGHPVSFFTENQGHQPRSLLFKPGMSAVFAYRDLMPLLGAHDDFSEVDYEPGSNIFRIRIVSDGRKAYLKRTG